ncbi:hypothetical protein P389DRAFT_37252 [Cystobasidium minutum MCA 4210]|uniref:uncharacterized protein n=1 Tax=Cystobasidium minutum MCA 4210 TaxID=1397322 RepID=UPI0034CE75CB|eukprot:jgi/Rhomi1/37252/CE37251_2030
MQAAESSSSSKRRHPYNEEDDKLDKLAESSAQASVRRLSTSNNIDNQASQRRNTSMSTTTTTNGIDKGKSRLLEEQEKDHDARENEDMNAEDSEVSLYESDDDESIHCAICLSVIDDRTIVQPCCHDAYCFVCILAWTEQSRRCPLCVANIELLIHNIRGEKDFQKHYLPPLLKSDSPPPERSLRELREGARRQLFNRPTHPRFKYADWKARNRPAALPEVDAEDLALEKRRYVYKHGLYVKHVASNRFTRFRDWSAQQVSTTPELKQITAQTLLHSWNYDPIARLGCSLNSLVKTKQNIFGTKHTASSEVHTRTSGSMTELCNTIVLHARSMKQGMKPRRDVNRPNHEDQDLTLFRRLRITARDQIALLAVLVEGTASDPGVTRGVLHETHHLDE